MPAAEETGHPVIYPNPSDGTQPIHILVPGRAGTAEVTIRIFTLAFRLVQQQKFEQVPLGTNKQVELKDRAGKPLASGLYYVVVTIDSKRTVEKLLILQ
jgi:hypothetical protein